MSADGFDTEEVGEELVPLGEVLALMPKARPPTALDEERATLAGILVGGVETFQAARAEGLEAEHFGRPQHVVVFRAMQNLIEADEPLDVLNIVDELNRTAQLDFVGGAAAVSQLGALLPTSAHVPSYARRIVESAAKRAQVEYAQNIIRLACSPGVTSGAVAQAIARPPPAPQGRARSGFLLLVEQARRDIEAELGGVSGEAMEPLFESTAALADEEIADTAWLIEGILTESAVAAISGEPKTTKTFCAISMAIALANARKCFGEFWVPRARPVALFLTEDGRRGLRNRARAFAAAEGITFGEATALIYHRCLKKLDLRRIEHAAWLLASLRALPVAPALLVLDPLRNLIGDANEDKAHEMAPVLETLRAIRNLTGATVLFVHHSTKFTETTKGRRGGQKMRGTGALHGALDCGMYLDDLKGNATTRWLNTATIEIKDAQSAGRFGIELNVKDEKKAAVHAEFTFWRDPKAMYDAAGDEPAPTEERRGDANRTKVLGLLKLSWERACERNRPDAGHRNGDLARMADLSPQTITRIGNALVRDGRADFDDGFYKYRPEVGD